jgi:hypothetical protein
LWIVTARCESATVQAETLILCEDNTLSETFVPDVVAEITAGSGLNLGAAARRFPSYRGSRPVNCSTIFRWITSGVRLRDGTRLRLEAARVGGRWLTSGAAIERFITRQTPQFSDIPAPARNTERQRERAAQAAGKLLEAMGS